MITIISFVTGFGTGYVEGVKFAISYGLEFVDIDVDENMITTALFQYKNNVGGCLFTQNASLHIDERD